MKMRVAFLAASALCLMSWGSVFAADQLPDLRFTEDRFDIGCVGVDFKIRHTFKLVNHGTNTIHIDTVTAHCDCTEVRFRDSTLAPGDTARILMIFSTANFYGPVEKDVRVVSTDSKMPAQQINYTAVVGQWLLKIEPRPVNVFFMPSQKVRISSLLNHAVDNISLTDIYLDEPVVDINVSKSEASKGDSLVFVLTPKPELPAGTHLTNYTVSVDLHQNTPPLRITIPVKVVKY